MISKSAHLKRPLQGLTLIEMLVVIAIIGILASMLMPLLMKSIEAGRQVSCVNNLRQIGIGIGISMYSDDNKGYIMPVYLIQSGVPVDTWVYNLFPYIDTIKIFLCPSDMKTLTTFSKVNSFDDLYYSGRYGNYPGTACSSQISYSFNDRRKLKDGTVTDTTYFKTPFMVIRNKKIKGLIADGEYFPPTNNSMHRIRLIPTQSFISIFGTSLSTRHNGNSNILQTDGSVISEIKIWAQKNIDGYWDIVQ